MKIGYVNGRKVWLSDDMVVAEPVKVEAKTEPIEEPKPKAKKTPANKSRKEVKNKCSDQGGDISVEDRGKCLSEALLNSSLNGLTCSDLLTDTGKDYDIRIHGHTNRQDDTCDTGKGHGNLECGKHHDHHACVDQKSK